MDKFIACWHTCSSLTKFRKTKLLQQQLLFKFVHIFYSDKNRKNTKDFFILYKIRAAFNYFYRPEWPRTHPLFINNLQFASNTPDWFVFKSLHWVYTVSTEVQIQLQEGKTTSDQLEEVLKCWDIQRVKEAFKFKPFENKVKSKWGLDGFYSASCWNKKKKNRHCFFSKKVQKADRINTQSDS